MFEAKRYSQKTWLLKTLTRENWNQMLHYQLGTNTRIPSLKSFDKSKLTRGTSVWFDKIFRLDHDLAIRVEKENRDFRLSIERKRIKTHSFENHFNSSIQVTDRHIICHNYFKTCAGISKTNLLTNYRSWGLYQLVLKCQNLHVCCLVGKISKLISILFSRMRFADIVYKT